ncbi:unknown [Prevotella sp. CAG:924]|nr:unknown [Prevotella sp. CAG:924]
MDRLVQPHLDGADDFHIRLNGLQEFVAAVGRAHVRIDKCVHVFSFQPGEGIFLVTQFGVECEVDLHLTVNDHVGVVSL